ncbi:hypothetical protein ABT269_35675 [Streptomyces viridosporus]|uniref:hypothetical protein n=1 Tax=Streptomyces viridosporus TaxID=67581 RepID=UPI003318965F
MGDRLSALDLGVRQHEQGSQQRGGVPGVRPDPGQEPPVLQAGEAMLGGDALTAEMTTRLAIRNQITGATVPPTAA